MMTRRLAIRFGGSAYVLVLSLFLVLPLLIIVPSSFSVGEALVFPPKAYSLRWYEQLVSSSRWHDSALLSLRVALCAVVLAVPIALMAALASVRFRAVSSSQRIFLLLPSVVPHSVIATGLFTLLLKLGMLEDPVILVVVHATFALPYAFLLFVSALEAIDPLIWNAAATLGASPQQVLSKVILRIIWPSVISAALLVLVMSWDEIVASVFVGPISPPTLPSLMFSYLQETVTPVVAAVASLLLVISIAIGVVMLALSGRNTK